MPPAISAAEAGVRVELIAPPTLATETPISLTYRLADARTGAPVADIVESHERPLHLIAVRRDLRIFQHVHPTSTGRPGEFAIDITFPAPGTYLLFGEFARAGGQHFVQRDDLAVGVASGAPNLVEDWEPKTVDGVRVTLLSPNALPAGHGIRLTLRIEDARTGEGVHDLQPYLGAPAHVVILTEDGHIFGHTHGEATGTEGGHAGHGGHSGHSSMSTYGPEIAFEHIFPAPGLYKLWGQFRTGEGHLATADFVVRAR
jgi:Cu+-exporting ATPase